MRVKLNPQITRYMVTKEHICSVSDRRTMDSLTHMYQKQHKVTPNVLISLTCTTILINTHTISILSYNQHYNSPSL